MLRSVRILVRAAMRIAMNASASGIDTMSRYTKLLIVVLAVAEIVSCCLLMSVNPMWNGENPMHRNQYELIADSFIDGKLYFEYDDVDPRLEEMDNPYSPQERKRAGVSYHKDHA